MSLIISFSGWNNYEKSSIDRELVYQSEAEINIPRLLEANPDALTGNMELMGSSEKVRVRERLIMF